MSRETYIDRFTAAYIECALWSSTYSLDPDGNDSSNMDDGAHELADAAREYMASDARDFVNTDWRDLADLGPEQCGHDFWLTRNGHGAGFWDRGLGDVGDRLTRECRAFGEADLYIGDDSLIHAEGEATS